MNVQRKQTNKKNNVLIMFNRCSCVCRIASNKVLHWLLYHVTVRIVYMKVEKSVLFKGKVTKHIFIWACRSLWGCLLIISRKETKTNCFCALFNSVFPGFEDTQIIFPFFFCTGTVQVMKGWTAERWWFSQQSGLPVANNPDSYRSAQDRLGDNWVKSPGAC